MYSYNICEEANSAEFNKACDLKEKYFSFHKQYPLIDVDRSIIQEYVSGNMMVKAFKDYEVDAVYIESNTELNNIFGQQQAPLKMISTFESF